MNKRITTSILAALMIAGTTSFSAFAAIGSGTVVIGTKAYDLEYANNKSNLAEITTQINLGGPVYVKKFIGTWVNNATGVVVAASVIPAVTYKSAAGEINYAAADGVGTPVVVVTPGGGGSVSNTYTASISNGTHTYSTTVNKSDTIGAAYNNLKGLIPIVIQDATIKPKLETELARLKNLKDSSGNNLLQLAANKIQGSNVALYTALHDYIANGTSAELVTYFTNASFQSQLDFFNIATGGDVVIPQLAGDKQIFATVTSNGFTVEKKAGSTLDLSKEATALGITNTTTLSDLKTKSGTIQIVTGTSKLDANGVKYSIVANNGTITITTPISGTYTLTLN